MDECELGEAMCHENAACSDVVGGEDSYNCTCNPGFSGDGLSCVGKLTFVTDFVTHTYMLMMQTTITIKYTSGKIISMK